MLQHQRTPRLFQIAAATVGNALEWYDFMIFGYLTAVVSRLFFPASSEYGSLLATTATFGVGFCMRPVGGLIIGMYADRKGRKAALQLIVLLTTISMAMMAFAPTYAAFGIGAPLIIVAARLLQGFATGGEFSSSTSFLVECAPPHRRGLFGSWQMFGQLLAMIGGTAIGALITAKLSPDALNSWGWRVPFLLGMLIAPVGVWIRKHVEDPEVYIKAAEKAPKMPLIAVMRDHRRALLVCTALITSGTMCTYILNVYMPIFAQQHLHLPLSQAFTAMMVAGMTGLALVPLMGALSDRIGRKTVMIASMGTFLLLLYPMFSWVTSNHSFINLAITLAVLTAARAGYGGVVSTVLAEEFPTVVRSTGMALSYNFAVMAFGGTAQVVVTWLIHVTGTPMSAAVYLMVAAVTGVVAAFFIRQPAPEMQSEPEALPAVLSAGLR